MPVNFNGQTIYISFVWGLIFIAVILVICFIPALLSYKSLTQKTWACPNCGHQFNPKLYQVFTASMNKACMMRCPKCRKADWHSYRD